MLRKDMHEDNRKSWNAATEAHNSHKADQAAFFRGGGNTLFPEEIELLGDITGKSLVHLQCNAGQDTLSLARLGASVTGVDISDTAIAFASKLAADSGIPAAFVRSDVYDWLATTEECFDVVFSSYGALCWLSDIRLWAKGVAGILKPGGRYVTVEFHPFSMVFDWDWKPHYPYSSNGEPTNNQVGIGDYVAMSGPALTPSGYVEGVQNFVNPNPSYEFAWGLGDIVTALVEAGLSLRVLREYPYSNATKLFEPMREAEGKRFYPPDSMPSLPMMYGVVAEKR